MPKGEYGGSVSPDEKDLEARRETSEKEGELPILEYEQEIKETFRNNSEMIVVGETGSGKTTEIPLMLLEELGEDKKIIVTQPRKGATRSVTRYVAFKAGCRVGEEVGYKVRFEDETSAGTKLNFMTDGVLLRIIQNDPLLSEYSAVMIDEAHERSLNIDFTLGLLKKLQKEREKAGLQPIKIVVTSATLEKEKFSKYFGGAPSVEVPGRMYPVDVHHMESDEQDNFLDERGNFDYTRAAAGRVRDIVESDKEGDILIFMPGEGEIKRTVEQIEKLEVNGVELLKLYGRMSPEDQDKIFEESSQRKIIVSTNIAETSLTIPGIKHIIDSGLIKQNEFDSRKGIEALVTKRHAKSGCTQRMGRAGRTASGECWRLYSKDDFEERDEFQIPEIKRSGLAHTVLIMKDMGIEDVESFEFIDQPLIENIQQALKELKSLGALDEDENITKIGKTMAELPLEPKIARMVVEAEKYDCVETVCTITAFLGGKSVFNRPREKESKADLAHEQFKVRGSDFLSLLKVWKEYERNRHDYYWARDNFLDKKVLKEVEMVRFQLFKALRRNGIRATENEDPEVIGKSIAAGLIGNLMVSNEFHSYRRIEDSQPGFYIHPGSAVFESGPKFFVTGKIFQTSKKFTRRCQEVKPEWLPEIAPHLVEAREHDKEMTYKDDTGEVIEVIPYEIKGESGVAFIVKKKIKGERASELLAKVLVGGEILVAEDEKIGIFPEIATVIEQNKLILEYLERLAIKRGR
ncbi:MAG: ATP-dependent RNA helicase [Parcubacteria group bacterium]|nr:ATP-dependent RNA helicase [Parcubacteria group bacterium]